MIEKRTTTIQNSVPPGRHIPKVIKWKGVNMIRNQSFLASVKEIIDYSTEMDVVRIGIIGDMHSGKSTLSMTISHAIHTYSKIPFNVRVFYKEDLKNFKQTIQSLPPANYVIVFDDVSFLKASATNREINMIEEAITTIRHLDDGRDVKIITIFNYHYPKALPPFLREAQFKYITSIGDSNEKQISDIYGKNNIKLVVGYKMMRKIGIVKKMWFEKISAKGEPIKYKWRNPFIPVLFWNESSLRKIVSPTRYFMDKICSKCEEAEGNKQYDEKTVSELCDQGEVNFTKGNFIAAIKLLMHSQGLTLYGKKVVRSLRWIEKERKVRNMPLEAFATHYGLTETKTRMRAKPFEEVPN